MALTALSRARRRWRRAASQGHWAAYAAAAQWEDPVTAAIFGARRRRDPRIVEWARARYERVRAHVLFTQVVAGLTGAPCPCPWCQRSQHERWCLCSRCKRGGGSPHAPRPCDLSYCRCGGRPIMPVLETERVSSGDLFGGEALGARALDAAARGALRGRLLRRLHRAVRAALGAADPTVASWATDWLLAQDVDACYRLGPRGPEVRTADGEWLTAAEVEERLHRARNLVQAVDRLGVVEQIRRDAERSAVAAIFYRRLAATSLGPDGAGPLTIPAPSEAELAHARERLPAVWAAVRAACARR